MSAKKEAKTVVTEIPDGRNLDLSKIIFGKVKPHAMGGKIIPVLNVDTGRDYGFTIPLMTTWGSQEGKTDAGAPNGKFSTSLQFPDETYPNANASKVQAEMVRFEAFVKDYFLEHSVDMFGKEIKSMETIDNLFGAMLKQPNKKGTKIPDFDRPPTMTVKIPRWKNGYITEVFDYETNEQLFDPKKADELATPMDFIPVETRTEMALMVESGSIWIISNKVFITWNMRHAVVKQGNASAAPSTSWMAKETGHADAKPLTMVDDSDDEGDKAESETVASTPAAVEAPAAAAEEAPVVAAAAPAIPKKRKVEDPSTSTAAAAAAAAVTEEKPAVKKPKLVKKKAPEAPK